MVFKEKADVVDGRMKVLDTSVDGAVDESVTGANVVVAQERDSVVVERDGEMVRLPREIASRVFVAAR